MLFYFIFLFSKRYDLTSVRISVTKKINNNWSWFRCWERGTFVHYCWEHWLVLALRDNYRSSFKNENDYMVRLFNIWVFSQRKWDMDDKEDTSVPMFDAALFTIYRADILHPGPFMAEWVKNIWYILNRILFTCRQMASYHLHWNVWNWKTLC